MAERKLCHMCFWMKKVIRNKQIANNFVPCHNWNKAKVTEEDGF